MVRLQMMQGDYSVCRIADASQVDFAQELVFLCKTEEELSLVCKANMVPLNAQAVEHGWKMLRIAGTLDFALVGVLAPILQLLAKNAMPVFVVSTYNTDYILLKEAVYEKAVNVLRAGGYEVTGHSKQ